MRRTPGRGSCAVALGAFCGHGIEVQPDAYPWTTLPRVSRADTLMARAMLRAVPRLNARYAASLAAIVGLPCELRRLGCFVRSRPLAMATGADDLLIAMRRPARDDKPSLWLRLNARFVQLLLAALFERRPERSKVAGHPIRDIEHGMLAYLAARIAAEQPQSACWCVEGVGGASPQDAWRGAMHPDEMPGCWMLGEAEVCLGVETASLAFAVDQRLVDEDCLEAGCPGSIEARWPLLRLASCVVDVRVATASLSAAEVESLRPGDVLLVDAHALDLSERGSSALAGNVDLLVGELKVADGILRADGVLEWGASILRGGEASRKPAYMPEDQPLEEPTQPRVSGTVSRTAVADASLELSIEVARIRMRLEEISALQPGEVLRTGRRLGSTALIRAGEAPIAWGELVDVEGELGVRIERLEEPR